MSTAHIVEENVSGWNIEHLNVMTGKELSAVTLLAIKNQDESRCELR